MTGSIRRVILWEALMSSFSVSRFARPNGAAAMVVKLRRTCREMVVIDSVVPNSESET